MHSLFHTQNYACGQSLQDLMKGMVISMEISLSKLDWQVKGYWPYVPIKEKSMETGQQLHGVTPWIPAKVPGGVHYDLYRAGYITNPYYGLDSLKCEWIESRWWMYRTVFQSPITKKNNKVELIFEGLDYEASIFVNDVLLAEHRGMYKACRVDITKVLKEENKLVVVFKGIPQEMGQIGYTSKTSTQKSRFNYKWDFSTRLVNIGFWKDVKLKVCEEVELSDIFVRTDVKKRQGIIQMEGKVFTATPMLPSLTFQLFEPEDSACIQSKQILADSDGSFKCKFIIDQPKLWYPNGSGEQPLYTLKIITNQKNTQQQLYTQQLGIRSLSFVHNEREHENALPYTVKLNGKKIYIKGMNITPLDHIYGNVTKEQYEFLIDMAVNANVNMLRIWGGGLIEKEWLYDLCDKKGIMIWQEFIQSSSGIDNAPPLNRAYLQLLHDNSLAAIKEKRNHVSLTVWSGGNELMKAPDTPCRYDNPNIHMLKELVEQYDPGRMFLPTSASGPREFISFDKGVSHDVHGSWRYEGNPRHYELYGSSDNLFHSEFGMDGTSSLKSLKKFLPKEAWYPTPMSGNLYWQHHGEWWGTYGRDTQMFGAIDQLDLFVQCSQFMQAEGLRFIIEANRRRKYQNSGCIIWQLNEPWPNASCTNLLDYYGEAKPAFYRAKEAYAPIHISMNYRKLDYVLGEEFSEKITLHNSSEEFHGKVVLSVRNMDGEQIVTKTFEQKMKSNTANDIGSFDWYITDVSDVFFIELTVWKNEQRVSRNVYQFALQQEHLFEPLKMCKTNINLYEVSTEVLEAQIIKTYALKNTGNAVAVHAGIELEDDGYWMLAEDNFITLFPQEEQEIKVSFRRKYAGTFLSEENFDTDKNASNEAGPRVKAIWFGCGQQEE
jgi:beta-mannosidase